MNREALHKKRWMLQEIFSVALLFLNGQCRLELWKQERKSEKGQVGEEKAEKSGSKGAKIGDYKFKYFK